MTFGSEAVDASSSHKHAVVLWVRLMGLDDVVQLLLQGHKVLRGPADLQGAEEEVNFDPAGQKAGLGEGPTCLEKFSSCSACS